MFLSLLNYSSNFFFLQLLFSKMRFLHIISFMHFSPLCSKAFLCNIRKSVLRPPQFSALLSFCNHFFPHRHTACRLNNIIKCFSANFLEDFISISTLILCLQRQHRLVTEADCIAYCRTVCLANTL